MAVLRASVHVRGRDCPARCGNQFKETPPRGKRPRARLWSVGGLGAACGMKERERVDGSKVIGSLGSGQVREETFFMMLLRGWIGVFDNLDGVTQGKRSRRPPQGAPPADVSLNSP
ncbi:hypothetical protein VTI74DRAFT_6847 [Chaetomium olivicolor]